MTPRRSQFKKGLSPVYLPFYEALCDLLPESWQPVSGLRSWDIQAKLYAQGRTTAGSIVTRAKPGWSFHQYGLASDWEYFPDGKYTPLEFDDPRWLDYQQACDKIGVSCVSWEKPHNQHKTSLTIKDILEVYASHGQSGVDQFLREEY